MNTHFVSQNAVLNATQSPGSLYFLYGQADFVTMFGGNNNTVAVSENNATLNIYASANTTILDYGQGMHLNLDPFTALTTVKNFQNDLNASVDMFNSPYLSQLDVADHMAVVAGYGTVLTPKLQGPPAMLFPGDYAVNTGQFHTHPSAGISG